MAEEPQDQKPEDEPDPGAPAPEGSEDPEEISPEAAEILAELGIGDDDAGDAGDAGESAGAGDIPPEAEAILAELGIGDDDDVAASPESGEDVSPDAAAILNELEAALAEDTADSVSQAAGAVSEAAGLGDAPPLPDFDASPAAEAEPAGMSLLHDVELRVQVELGRTRMYVEDVLRLTRESVIELDKAAGDPVDIYVNQRHVARGEVLVLNENFCVRVSEIVQDSASPET